MLHWSSSWTVLGSREAYTEPAEEAPFAQRLVSRVVTHLGDTFRHFQRHASMRASTFGWEGASIRTSDEVWIPCPQCKGASMARVSVPVPNEVFECPVCHAIVTDARGVTYDVPRMLPPRVDLPTVDYDSWLIDDPRR